MEDVIQAGQRLLDAAAFNKSKMKVWQLHGQRYLANEYDSELSKEFGNLFRGGVVVRRGMTEYDFYRDIYRPRIVSALDFLESVKEIDLPKKTPATKTGHKQPKELTQNFYLTQTQVQHVQNDLNLSAYDLETREHVEELLNELKKHEGKDKSKITETVKWLADRSIDVLIALLARQQ